MKLFKKFIFSFLCCFSMIACNAGNILARMVLTQERYQQRLNIKLIDAAERGDLPKVQQALVNGANIHADNDRALQVAAQEGHLPIVKFLVEQGDSIHARNYLALQWAVCTSHWAVAACLLQRGADRIKLNNAEQQQDLQHALRTSAQVHAYILAELRTALSSNDW